MIIKKTAVGNSIEAFIQHTFSDHFNIISSDDNNRGKTIEIQSMLYALGNEPVFPTSFEYKNYYHYVEFEENEILYKLCRSEDGFILKYNNKLMIFENVAEFKRFWNNYIFELPKIIKNGSTKIVDPVLFFQLFFVGQDKKDTAILPITRLYNKDDFYNMLFSICDLSGITLTAEETDKIKEKIKKLKNQQDILLKKHKILKSNNTSVSYLSSINDRDTFNKKVSELDRVKAKIAELRNKRNQVINRKLHWEITLKELISLNRAIDFGELHCMDCGSTNIALSSSRKGAYTFDVSTVELRQEIVLSINEKVAAYEEEMEKISNDISVWQERLQDLISDENISIESIVALKKDFLNVGDVEKELNYIHKQIDELNSMLAFSVQSASENKIKQQTLINEIVSLMTSTYNQIDPNGNLHFEGLFTKKDEIYSGSEATVFHLVKLYALAKVLKHNYPIIVDSFRAEDLSTNKEEIVVNLFKQLSNQIIFTTTLKAQELGKYDKKDDINHIDYTNHQPSKMLTAEYVNEFIDIISNLSIRI